MTLNRRSRCPNQAPPMKRRCVSRAHRWRVQRMSRSTVVLHSISSQGALAMSTTTIRLPQDLKKRIARAAERAGTTAHSFILQAIAEKAEQEELLEEFQDTAGRRYAAIVSSGKTVPWNQMRRYLERQLSGKSTARPKPRALVR